MKISRGNNVLTITVLLLLLLFDVGANLRPTILSQPRDVTVIPSAAGPRTFTILCIKSLGSSVAWYRNGKLVDISRHQDLKMSSDGSLHVTSALKDRDEGSYHCLVYNKNKAVLSRKATVKFAYLDPFGVQGWVASKEEGSHITIRCVAPESFPHRTIQWSKEVNGVKQPVRPSSRLTISQERDLHFAYLEASDSGFYICTVTNIFINKNVERKVSLHVEPATTKMNKPPGVMSDFSLPKTALKGEKFVLECIVYGRPVPKITMRKKGIHTTLGNTTGNVNRLVINSFGRDDAGKYKCRASDQSGPSDTKTTVIKMEAKPEWIIKPQDTTSGSNTTITLPCVAYGIPGVRYTWYRNGKPIVWTNKHEITKGNLTIKDLRPQDNGMYQCFVDNKHGQLHADIELTVSEIPAGFGPGSRSPQPTQSALMHSSVKLACNPTGEPKPMVRWRFGATYLHSSGRFHISSNGNLRIANVTKSDSGEYTCEASNRLGKASRKGFVNVVEYIIETENMDKTATAVLGKNVRFLCGVKSISGIEVTFKWLKYLTHEIVPNSHVEIATTDIRNRMLSTSDQKGYLRITGVRYTDAGPYSCEIRGNNNKLIAYKVVLLKVKGPPDPPTNVDIKSGHAEGEYVNVTWVLGKANNSPIKKLIIQHTTQFSPKTWQLIAEETEPLKGWTQIALSPNVRYTFRVIAVNNVGTSTPSAPSGSFQAPPAAPTKYPLKLRGEGTSPSTLKITWQPLPPINHHGPGFYYIVYHKKANSKGQLIRNEVRNGSSFYVMDTDYYVKYTIQIQAANKIGFGPKSPVVIGYSGEQVPVGSPRDLDVRITSATSAYATWTGVPNTRKTARGKLLGYKVYFWKAPSGQTPHQASYKATIDTSTTLHLEAFTSYRFQVVAYNSVGDGPASNVIGPLITPESIPDSPRGLSLNIHNQTFMILQWSPPEKVNGIITDYQVTVQRIPERGMTMSGHTNDSTPEMRLPLLDRQARYKFSVLAINRIGKGPPVAVEFDLTTAPQMSPKNVTAVFVDRNKEVVLSWKSLLTDIEGFRIFYWSSEKDMQTVDVAKTRRRKEIAIGLENGHIYHFQLAAFKIVHGGHYILGPRSKEVRAGNVPVRPPERAESSGSFIDSPGTLLLCSQLVFLISLQWLQAR